MVFKEDDAVEIAAASDSVEKFENKHPNCVWNIEKMKPKATEIWIKKHPKAVANPPKNLWIVELEELEKEKLIIVIDPLTQKIVGTSTEKLKPEPEEEDED
ncbi:MAG: hypothetical protein ACFFD2_16985 [Promethearchaeota archaeon]